MMIAISIFALAAAQAVEPDQYPELATDRLLPLIVADLKTELPDPYSIRDLTICPASRVKLKDGKPHSWTVRFALNAKGASGGYTGLTSYAVAFKAGRINLHAFPTSPAGREGLDGLIHRSIMRQLGACKRVPDAVLQELLAL